MRQWLLVQAPDRGGGELADSPEEATFLLSEHKSDCKGDKNLPLQFIVDCVKKNSFIDPKKYRESYQDKSPISVNPPSTSTANVEDVVSDDELFSRTFTLQVSKSALAGRSKYTDAEDLKIIRYLIFNKKCNETGGNVVWKQKQAAKVTDHPHQSMKARFKKKILPDVNSYDIPDMWKKMLSGQDISLTARRLPHHKNGCQSGRF
ncbi:hypothetical protein RRG08_042125 [Elysia crispata]|uniref:Telomeric repeat-binding factor 2-interacting protein 1 n=1 Tax=Elysia crispata TaxID=231223 RepID=A0AAE0Z1E6_9GAST|nr:hypothetical protein RRG08_042125 [Elysia crispata]